MSKPKVPYYGPPGTPRIVERTLEYGDGTKIAHYVVQQLAGYCPERWLDVPHEMCTTKEEAIEALRHLVIRTTDTVVHLGTKNLDKN